MFEVIVTKRMVLGKVLSTMFYAMHYVDLRPSVPTYKEHSNVILAEKI